MKRDIILKKRFIVSGILLLLSHNAFSQNINASNNALFNNAMSNGNKSNLSSLNVNPTASQLTPNTPAPGINIGSQSKNTAPSLPSRNTNAAPSPLNSAPLTSQRAPRAWEFVDPHDPEVQQFDNKVIETLKNRVLQDLSGLCPDYCQLLAVHNDIAETFDNHAAQLGFENTSQGTGVRRFFVKKSSIDVLIDERFGQQNTLKLKGLLQKLAEQFPYTSSYRFVPVVFPDTAETTRIESDSLRDSASQIKARLSSAISQYCPQECEILGVDLDAIRVPLDESQPGNSLRYLTPRGLRGAIYIRGVKVNGAFNALMEPLRKSRIESIFRELLKPFGAVTLTLQEVAFPKSAQEVQKDLDESRSDPFGLEKMARALKIFKDHANTKEIIKETTQLQKEERTQSRDKETEKSAHEKSSKESSQSSEANHATTQNHDSSWVTPEKLWLIAGVLIALIAAASLGLYFIVNGKRTKLALAEAQRAGAGAGHSDENEGSLGYDHPAKSFALPYVNPSSARTNGFGLGEQVKIKLDAQKIKDELLEAFLLQPKLARYLFRRVIRENGIEYASKCMIILGETVVFEALNEEDLKNDLSTLAEYVHVNTPVVSDDEQFEILKHLKLKVSAGKLHQKASNSLDMFDFLKGKSPQQIFELIHDESPQSQAIVLTQLPGQKRRSVFDLFEGNKKVKLLKQLSSGDAVPRHYLMSVALAFQRKASNNPRFDAELVRGTDVLLELIERADLQSQREIMWELDKSNPDASWLLRSKIVTIETLAFLRDSLLVDIFLTLDPHDMTVLLAGARDHIRDLVLTKAPRDLAEVWQENLSTMRTVDPEAYKLAELQVISKLRALVASGTIHLMEVNQMIYPVATPETPGEWASDAQDSDGFRADAQRAIVA